MSTPVDLTQEHILKYCEVNNLKLLSLIPEQAQFQAVLDLTNFLSLVNPTEVVVARVTEKTEEPSWRVAVTFQVSFDDKSRVSFDAIHSQMIHCPPN